LDKKMKGPDHLASLNPLEFKNMVDFIRRFQKMNGSGNKTLLKCEIKNKKIARKSIVAKKYITKGDRFTYENLTAKRPGSGICVSNISKYINKKSKRNFYPDDLIK